MERFQISEPRFVESGPHVAGKSEDAGIPRTRDVHELKQMHGVPATTLRERAPALRRLVRERRPWSLVRALGRECLPRLAMFNGRFQSTGGAARCTLAT